MPIKFLIFDSDGTLFDSLKTYTRTFVDMLSAPPYNIPPKVSNEFYLQTTGESLNVQLMTILTNQGIESPNIDKLVKKFYTHLSHHDFHLFNDVKEVLPRLKKYTKIIVSAADRELLYNRLRSLRMIEVFDFVYGVDSHTPNKEAALEKIENYVSGFSRDLAMLVGDGKYDMQLANKNGFVSVGREGTFLRQDLIAAGAQYTIPDFFELEKILYKLNGQEQKI